MDYKYDDGIELLLNHMNIEDIIDAVESLYQIESKVGVAEEASKEGLGFGEGDNEEMDDSEEAGESGSEPGGRSEGGVAEEESGEGVDGGAGGVKYGKATDLLDFINLVSDMALAERQHLPEEMGVVLNKVRARMPLFKQVLIVLVLLLAPLQFVDRFFLVICVLHVVFFLIFVLCLHVYRKRWLFKRAVIRSIESLSCFLGS